MVHSVALSTLMWLWNCHHIICRTFPFFSNEPSCPVSTNAPLSSPAPATTILLSVTLTILGASHKWNLYSICVFVISVFHSIMSSRFTHIVRVSADIPFLSKAEQRYVVCMDHIVFIRLSTERCFSGFHLLLL